jgi:hypothetical protein
MRDTIYETAHEIGKMDQEQLSQLAELLVLLHEGRAVKLSSFIEFEHQDKNLRALEELC